MSVEIKAKIDANNKIIEENMVPGTFVLNDCIKTLILENQKLQSKCKHQFEDGKCIFCYKEEK